VATCWPIPEMGLGLAQPCCRGSGVGEGPWLQLVETYLWQFNVWNIFMVNR